MSVRSMKVLALWCGALVACTEGPSTQVLTGKVDTSKGALAIRAVSDGNVVTATPVRTDGSFTLTLPAGTSYRLEVLTRTGVRNIVHRSGNVLRDLSFTICQPSDPFDVGGIGDPGTEGLCMPGDPNCKPCDPAAGMPCEEPPPPPTCDPMDPSCGCQVVAADGTCCQAGDPSCGPLPCEPGSPNCEPPSPCDPMTGNCEPPPTGCEPGSPNCEPPPPPCDPMTGNCEPPGCEPGSPNCEPPHCDPMTGNCPPPTGCEPGSPNCEPPPPCMGPNDPSCGGCSDPNAPGCAPPCDDPMDPSTCKDPCIDDPASCGCMIDPGAPNGDPNGPNGTGEPSCWPAPQPCCDSPGTSCDPSDGMAPDNVPGDFGCAGM